MTGVEIPIKSDKRKNCYCPTVAKAHLRNFKLYLLPKSRFVFSKPNADFSIWRQIFVALIWNKTADKYAGQYVQTLSI